MKKKTIKGFFLHVLKDKLALGAIAALTTMAVLTISQLWWMGTAFFLLLGIVLTDKIVNYLKS